METFTLNPYPDSRRGSLTNGEHSNSSNAVSGRHFLFDYDCYDAPFPFFEDGTFPDYPDGSFENVPPLSEPFVGSDPFEHFHARPGDGAPRAGESTEDDLYSLSSQSSAADLDAFPSTNADDSFHADSDEDDASTHSVESAYDAYDAGINPSSSLNEEFPPVTLKRKSRDDDDGDKDYIPHAPTIPRTRASAKRHKGNAAKKDHYDGMGASFSHDTKASTGKQIAKSPKILKAAVSKKGSKRSTSQASELQIIKSGPGPAKYTPSTCGICGAEYVFLYYLYSSPI